jgi:hypothetical protein
MNAYRRGLTIATSLIFGFLIGALFSALMYSAVLPVQRIVGQIGPSFLTQASAADAPGYREFYIAGVANRYKDRIGRGIPQDAALNEARNQLGVISGDTTPLSASQIVRIAFDVAKNENAKDVDQGWFTVADQNNLNELAAQLEASQNQPAVTSKFDESRSRLLLLGLSGLLLLSVVAGLAIYWVFGVDGRNESAINGSPRTGGFGNIAQQAIRSVPFGRSAQPTQPAQPAQNVVVVQQPPIVMQQPMQAVVATPVMAGADPNATGHMPVGPSLGETFLTTFDPTSYRHSDDAYEESFTILGATGEYLGECGVSIADRLDLATPSKVCALGVWVFDKNDPQFKSVMKVLMTPNAYNDPIIRNKLARLGEHVLAQNGMFDIATETMRVEATVSDLAVNPAGYFDTVNLAFNVYRKGVA